MKMQSFKIQNKIQNKCGVTVLALSTLAIGGWQIGVRSEGLQDSPEQQKSQHPPLQSQLQSQLRLWAQQAISPDATTANAAINSLREAGPDGMNALDRVYENDLRSAYSHPEEKQTEKWKRLSYAFEKAGMQRDNWASRLYWFTDLDKAKAEAQKTGKPILSLRLLGNLNDELSCANSRFFRTALYPNNSINMELRSHWVLHWQSVRAVPKVTIDFGDGRKIETTITGNSIHYALDANGRVLDALPGLYGPQPFEKWLGRAANLNEQIGKLEGAARDEVLRNYHQKRLQQITRDWQEDVRATNAGFPLDLANFARRSTPVAQPQILSSARQTFTAPGVRVPLNFQTGLPITEEPLPGKIMTPNNTSLNKLAPDANINFDDSNINFATDLLAPTARNAGIRAMSKISLETFTLTAFVPTVPRDRNALKKTTDDAMWTKIANLHSVEAQLDTNSLDVLRTKTPRASDVVRTFQASIAEDSVRNEYLRHTVLHEWLRNDSNIALDDLNKKVYAEIFLTPDSDPWLGLLPADAYTAIQNDGITTKSPVTKTQ